MSPKEIALKRIWKKFKGHNIEGPDFTVSLSPHETTINWPDADGNPDERLVDETTFNVRVFNDDTEHRIKLKDYLSNERFTLIVKKVDSEWHAKIK